MPALFVLGGLGLLALIFVRRGHHDGPSAAAGWSNPEYGNVDLNQYVSMYPYGYNPYAYNPYWVGAMPAAPGTMVVDQFAAVRNLAATYASNLRSAVLPPGVSTQGRDLLLHQLMTIADPGSTPESISEAIAAMSASGAGQASLASELHHAMTAPPQPTS